MSPVPGNNLSISGNNTDRVFIVDAGVTASLTGLTITGGYATPKVIDFNTQAGGGGILNLGTLTANQCTITGNVANQDIQTGGGVSNYGIFNATGTTFANNTVNGLANGGGGLAGNRVMAFQGFPGSTSTTTLVDCTFTQNNADGSRFGGGGALVDFQSSMTLPTVPSRATWPTTRPPRSSPEEGESGTLAV